jgi:hypothetical protein
VVCEKLIESAAVTHCIARSFPGSRTQAQPNNAILEIITRLGLDSVKSPLLLNFLLESSCTDRQPRIWYCWGSALCCDELSLMSRSSREPLRLPSNPTKLIIMSCCRAHDGSEINHPQSRRGKRVQSSSRELQRPFETEPGSSRRSLRKQSQYALRSCCRLRSFRHWNYRLRASHSILRLVKRNRPRRFGLSTHVVGSESHNTIWWAGREARAVWVTRQSYPCNAPLNFWQGAQHAICRAA